MHTESLLGPSELVQPHSCRQRDAVGRGWERGQLSDEHLPI